MNKILFSMFQTLLDNIFSHRKHKYPGNYKKLKHIRILPADPNKKKDHK